MIEVKLTKATNPEKKYKVIVEKDGKKKTIQFGQKGASDFTKHGDKERRERYDKRHKKREDWSITGIDTAGFWSKNLLWNKPSISSSIRDIEKRFKSVDIKK
jgi:hypothetical protein